MTKDEVIALAREAQIFLHHEDEMDVVGMPEVLRFAALVASEERELCAQVIESYPQWIGRHAREEISAAIRARGTQ